MTNETTASQPKAAESFKQAIFDTLYEMRLAPRHQLEEAARRISALSSQPKSIGDDAQFQNAVHDYRRFGNDEFLSKLVAIIDSRAPAAQASATIQAAPVGWTAKRVDEAGYGNILYSDRSSAEIAISHNGPTAPKYEIVPVFTAAIQEPVMVAEPVAYADPKAFENFSAGTATKEWMWAKPDAGLAPLYRAAPMVADPAGVAWTREQVLDLLLKEYISSAAARTLRNGDMVMFNLSNLTDFINLAATVKAVPSEVVTKLPSMKPDPLACIALAVSGALPDAQAGEILSAAFAAPLADKTGGGE